MVTAIAVRAVPFVASDFLLFAVAAPPPPPAAAGGGMDGRDLGFGGDGSVAGGGANGVDTGLITRTREV